MSVEEPPHLVDQLKTQHILNVNEYFEIRRCLEWCKANNFNNVALQFPDHLLAYAPKVATLLSTGDTSIADSTGGTEHIHILADTCYGSCCVDELAAQRLSTQAIIHYGHSCQSKVMTLPTLFIYGREELDLPDVVEKFVELLPHSVSRHSVHTELFSDNIVVIFDTIYTHYINQFRECVKNVDNLKQYNVWVKQPLMEQNTKFNKLLNCQKLSNDDDREKLSNDDDREKLSNVSVFYVGVESLFLSHIILSNSSRCVVSYDPLSKTIRNESKLVNKMLIKRFCNIEKIKKSKIIGILVGTLGIKHFVNIINRLKQVITAGGKKWYVICIGKPNPAKLGNFPEISAFVLVGCVENSLLDSSDYYQAIVTPYELEIGLIDREWGADYITDSSTLLTNNYIDIPLHQQVEADPRTLMMSKLNTMDIATTYLHERSWSGLEQRLGLDEPAVLTQGQRGIAGYYENEPPPDTCSAMKSDN